MKISLNLMTVGAIASSSAIGFLSFATCVNAQSFSLTSSPYTQNFNTLSNTNASWGNNSTIANWYSNRSNYIADAGGSGTGGLYSYGTTAGARALGSLGSNSARLVLFGVALTNNTGGTIPFLSIAFDAQHWRSTSGSDAVANTLTFEYKVGTFTTQASIESEFDNAGSGWTSISGLNYSPTVNTTGTPTTGLQESIPKLDSTNIANIAAGQQILLRWSDTNNLGNDAGMAIDNLSVEAVPEPTTILGGMAALGVGNAVRRKWQKKQQAAV
jgi:hypothetical protein